MEVVSIAFLVATVMKLTTFVKAFGKNTNMVVTQALVWLLALGVLAIAANADVAEHLKPFGDLGPELGNMDFLSLVLVAFGVGSGGSVVYDFKKARDNNDSAIEPALLPSQAA